MAQGALVLSQARAQQATDQALLLQMLGRPVDASNLAEARTEMSTWSPERRKEFTNSGTLMEKALSDRNSRLVVRGDRAALILVLHQDPADSDQERLIYRFQRVGGAWQLIPATAL